MRIGSGPELLRGSATRESQSNFPFATRWDYHRVGLNGCGNGRRITGGTPAACTDANGTVNNHDFQDKGLVA